MKNVLFLIMVSCLLAACAATPNSVYSHSAQSRGPYFVNYTTAPEVEAGEVQIMPTYNSAGIPVFIFSKNEDTVKCDGWSISVVQRNGEVLYDNVDEFVVYEEPKFEYNRWSSVCVFPAKTTGLREFFVEIKKDDYFWKYSYRAK